MQRTLFFAYGVACHALFLAIYIWMAAFVGNFGFGFFGTIDGIAREPFWRAMIINALLIGLFAVQHSVMARPTFKRWWTGIVPETIERSTYVLLSCLLIILLMWQWRPLGGLVWDVTHPAARAALHGLFAFGWVMVPAVSLLINHFDLFGSRQVWLHLRGRQYSSPPFREPMVYRYIRHPLYVGWMIAFWATPTMTVAHLLFAVGMTMYIFIAIPLEERNLLEHFGDKYADYRRRVGGLLPRLVGPAVRFNPGVVGDMTWWSWGVILMLLGIHFATGRREAIYAAIALCAALASYDVARRRGDRAAIGVQIRLAYTLLLAIGLLPGMGWMHVVQTIGTSVRLLSGYCLLERELRLMPWNLDGPLTSLKVWRTLMHPPRGGGLFRFGQSDSTEAEVAPACTLFDAPKQYLLRQVVPDTQRVS